MNDDQLRKAAIKLAHDNPGPIRDALLPVLANDKQAYGDDPADQARQMIDNPDTFFRNLDKISGELKRKFADAQRQLQGLDRYGSGTIEAPRVLGAVVQPKMDELHDFVMRSSEYLNVLARR